MIETSVKKFKLDVSKDKYQAYVTVLEEGVDPQDVVAALEANGIVYGIDNDAPFQAVVKIGEKVLVAAGQPHTDGSDGFIELTKSEQGMPCEKKFGFRNVYAGEIIGIIHKPTEGSVGIDVYGQKILPRKGRSVKVFTDTHIKRNETDDRIILEALADGNLKTSDTIIEVDPEFVISRDIDYSDGEIEFAGTLRINGDIKGKSCIKVKHDLLVAGSVEDAEIIAGGSVTIRGSFVGRGEGIIRAGRNVELNVVLNQMAEAGDSIVITKECVNGSLVAANAIKAPRAIIMGGSATAGELIEVHDLGGELYSTTRVKLGLRELLTDKVRAIDKEIDFRIKGLDEIKEQIYVLVRERMENNNFTSEKAEQLKLLQKKLQEENGAIAELNKRKEEISIELTRKRSPKLVVNGVIHQSVIAEINGVRFALKSSYRNVTFEEVRGEIIRTKNLGEE
ncbi:MAG: DUF342 domain-containing protein [Candidatus Kryptoniota bacterium]